MSVLFFGSIGSYIADKQFHNRQLCFIYVNFSLTVGTQQNF